MQRKNSILNSSYITDVTHLNEHVRLFAKARKVSYIKRSRTGIAMIMAIAVIVVIATIMALSLALTTQTTKRSTDLYLYEQAVLLSKSATEYALLRISQDGPCTHANDLNFAQDAYDINISMKYVYSTPSPCASATDDYFTITTPESSGSVLMDVTISTSAATEPIVYFKRTLQKL